MIRIKRKLIRPLKPQFSLLLKKFLEPIKGFLPPCNLTAFDIKEAFSTGPGSIKEQTKTISEFRFNQRSEFWEVFWNQSLKAQLLMLSHLMASLTATKHGDCGISREADIKIFLCINLKHFFALLSIPSQRSSAWLAWKQIFRRNFIWEFQEKKTSAFSSKFNRISDYFLLRLRSSVIEAWTQSLNLRLKFAEARIYNSSEPLTN